VSIVVKVVVGHDGLCTPGIDELPGWAFPAAGGPETGGCLEPLTTVIDSKFSANAHSTNKKLSRVLRHIANP
jgi:hypothetical protein